VVAATTLAIESLVLVWVHVKYGESTHIIGPEFKTLS
jgi:hypothetical protein